MPSLASFNANNFFLRYKFSNTFPGDTSRKSLVEAVDGAIGYLPGTLGGYSLKNYIIWDSVRRDLASYALREPDGKLPDILCFQEVENIQAIRAFNQHYLGNHYPYSLLIDGYDPRNIDVGILSRYPIAEVRSHIDDTAGGGRIFSRDCLETTIELPGNDQITLFLNHFKSKLVKKNKGESTASHNKRIRASHNRRKKQAAKVDSLIKERFSGKHSTALYAVIGDFNDTPYSPYLKPLMNSKHLTDVIRQHRSEDDCWTYFWRTRNRVSQIDFVLASKALAQRIQARASANKSRRPHIERAGIAYKEGANGILDPKLIHFESDAVTKKPAGNPPVSKKAPFGFSRYQLVNDDWKNNISDHCPVKVWF